MQFTWNDIYDALTYIEKNIIVYLSLKNTPISELEIQESLFLTSRVDDSLDLDCDFDESYFGAYSEAVSDGIDNLSSYRVIEKVSGYYSLTALGEMLYNMISIQDLLTYSELREQCTFFEGLTKDEIVFFILKEYPQKVSNSDYRASLERRRVKFAMSLYDKKKINIELATFFTKMSNEEFLSEINKKNKNF